MKVVALGAHILDVLVRYVTVIAGAEDSIPMSDRDPTRIPAFEVDVVDTTGCGDAYSASFLRGLSLGARVGS